MVGIGYTCIYLGQIIEYCLGHKEVWRTERELSHMRQSTIYSSFHPLYFHLFLTFFLILTLVDRLLTKINRVVLKVEVEAVTVCT